MRLSGTEDQYYCKLFHDNTVLIYLIPDGRRQRGEFGFRFRWKLSKRVDFDRAVNLWQYLQHINFIIAHQLYTDAHQYGNLSVCL